MAAQAGLCLAWSETPENMFCRVVAHIILFSHRHTVKIVTAIKIAVIILTMWFYHTLMHPKEAEGMTNSVDPDQTAPLQGGRKCIYFGWVTKLSI